MDESCDLSTASRSRGPSLIHVSFVVDGIVLRQVFCEYTSLLAHSPRLHTLIWHPVLVQ